MDILVYLQIFASITHAIIMFFLPRFVPYKTYVIILVALTALSIAIFIMRKKGKVPVTFGQIFVVYGVIIGLYALVTPSFYSSSPVSNHSGSLLCLAGQILPNGLFACFVAEDDELQDKVKKLAPIVGAVFAVIALICTLRPTMVTSAGLMDNENGLGYQRVSYMAAYSAALMEFYLLTRDQKEQFKFLSNRLGTIISGIAIFIDLLVTLFSGGRGGFVTYIIFFAISIFLALRFGQYDAKRVIRVFIIGIIAVIGAYVGIRYVANSSLATSGYGRILSLLANRSDTRRLTKYETAFSLFADKPILGHGFGSVYWELGQYTHNFFTDILVEGGALLFLFVVGVLLYGFSSSVKIVQKDRSDLIWIYFFMCGFSLAMFSGYYLTQIPLWWGLIFIIAKIKNIKCMRLSET